MKIKDLFSSNVILDPFRKNLKTVTFDNLLFRGINNASNYTVVNGLKLIHYKGLTSPRVSITGVNTAQQMTSFLPAWEHLPRRSFSSFSTGVLHKADNFGNIHIIIPADNVKSFACSNFDFNNISIGSTFSDKKTVHQVFAVLEDVIKIYNKDGERFDFTLSSVKKLSEWFSKQDLNKAELFDLLEALGDYSLEEFLLEKFTPEKMQIELVTSFDDVERRYYDEIWFEGDYLAIQFDDNFSLKQIVSILNKL